MSRAESFAARVGKLPGASTSCACLNRVDMVFDGPHRLQQLSLAAAQPVEVKANLSDWKGVGDVLACLRVNLGGAVFGNAAQCA